MLKRAGAVLLALIIAAASAVEALAGALWGFSLKCDDSCGTPPPWRDDPESWQWEALGFVGFAGLACALVFVACIAFGRRWVALATLGIWAVLAAWFLRLLDESGLTSHAGRGWVGIAALCLTGVAAAGLAERSARGRPRAASV